VWGGAFWNSGPDEPVIWTTHLHRDPCRAKYTRKYIASYVCFRTVRGQAGGIPSVGPTSIWTVLDRCLGLVITRHAAGHASIRRCPFHPHASTPPPPPTSFSLKHFPSDLPSLTAVAHPWPAPRRPTLALPLDMELQEGTAPPEAMEDQTPTPRCR
jgi:hypothetical protein